MAAGRHDQRRHWPGLCHRDPIQLAVEAMRIAGGPTRPTQIRSLGVRCARPASHGARRYRSENPRHGPRRHVRVCCEPGGTAYAYLPTGASRFQRANCRRPIPTPRWRASRAQRRCEGPSERDARGKQTTKEETLEYKLRDHAWFIAFAPHDQAALCLRRAGRARQPRLANGRAVCLRHPGASA